VPFQLPGFAAGCELHLVPGIRPDARPSGAADRSARNKFSWRRYSLRRLRSHASLSADRYKADNVLRFSDEGEAFMARFVEMPIAGGQQGQNVIVNIDLVRYIRSVKTGEVQPSVTLRRPPARVGALA
jgi:hypothetical protein